MSQAELLPLNFCCVAHFIVLDSLMQVLTDGTDSHRLYSVEIGETKIRRLRNMSHLLKDYFPGYLNFTR